MSDENKKKIAALLFQGWSVERISEHLMIPMFWVKDALEPIKNNVQ